MPPDKTLRGIALEVAARQLGKPYIWGGNDPVQGFDCSGLVIEALKAVGALPRVGDWTAGGLLNEVFRSRPRITRDAGLEPGMLVFWARDDGTIRHVEMVYARVGDTVLTIGASGGGSATLTPADAIKQDAYTKIRPVARNWVAAVDPF